MARFERSTRLAPRTPAARWGRAAAAACAVLAVAGVSGPAGANDRVLRWTAKADTAPAPVITAAPVSVAPVAVAPVSAVPVSLAPAQRPAPVARAVAVPSSDRVSNPALALPAATPGVITQVSPPQMPAAPSMAPAAPVTQLAVNTFAAPPAGPAFSTASPAFAATPRPGDQIQVTYFRVGAATSSVYTLQPGDQISVRVQNVAELTADNIAVLPDGSVTLPLIGSVPVSGQTTAAVAQTLTDLYSAQRVRDPRVSVLINQASDPATEFLSALSAGPSGASITLTVPRAGGVILPIVGELDPFQPLPVWREILNIAAHREFNGAIGVLANTVNRVDERVFVLGEVVDPGQVDLTQADTAFTAIASAGGVLKSAARNRIFVLRTAPSGTRQLLALNLDGLMRGLAAPAALALAPGDVVVVPPSRIAQTNTAVEQYIRNLLPFSVGVGVGLEFQQ